MNDVTSPALRTGVQAAVISLVLRAVEVMPSPDFVIDPNDKIMLTVVLTGLAAAAQNTAENKLGKKLFRVNS